MACFVNAHVMQSDDCSVGKLAYHSRFLNEALTGFSVGQFFWEKLNGHQTANQWIVGTGHASMGSCADDF